MFGLAAHLRHHLWSPWTCKVVGSSGRLEPQPAGSWQSGTVSDPGEPPAPCWPDCAAAPPAPGRAPEVWLSAAWCDPPQSAARPAPSPSAGCGCCGIWGPGPSSGHRACGGCLMGHSCSGCSHWPQQAGWNLQRETIHYSKGDFLNLRPRPATNSFYLHTLVTGPNSLRKGYLLIQGQCLSGPKLRHWSTGLKYR